MQRAMVRATCERCGDVELVPDEIELRICIAPERSVYAFTCPSCKASIVKSAADPRVVRVLASVGVPIVGWPLPVDVIEHGDAPPLTVDDLIDLMLLLEEPDAVARIASVPSNR